MLELGRSWVASKCMYILVMTEPVQSVTMTTYVHVHLDVLGAGKTILRLNLRWKWFGTGGVVVSWWRTGLSLWFRLDHQTGVEIQTGSGDLAGTRGSV